MRQTGLDRTLTVGVVISTCSESDTDSIPSAYYIFPVEVGTAPER
jgi:hypothetical protein